MKYSVIRKSEKQQHKYTTHLPSSSSSSSSRASVRSRDVTFGTAFALVDSESASSKTLTAIPASDSVCCRCSIARRASSVAKLPCSFASLAKRCCSS